MKGLQQGKSNTVCSEETGNIPLTGSAKSCKSWNSLEAQASACVEVACKKFEEAKEEEIKDAAQVKTIR